MLERLKRRAQALIGELVTLWLCARHPRTPLAAKVLATLIVIYAVSPIDLIPDFIPVIGYLDDVVLLSLGIWLVWKLVPHEIVIECREEALRRSEIVTPAWWKITATLAIIALWILPMWLAWLWWSS